MQSYWGARFACKTRYTPRKSSQEGERVTSAARTQKMECNIRLFNQKALIIANSPLRIEKRIQTVARVLFQIALCSKRKIVDQGSTGKDSGIGGAASQSCYPVVARGPWISLALIRV